MDTLFQFILRYKAELVPNEVLDFQNRVLSPTPVSRFKTKQTKNPQTPEHE